MEEQETPLKESEQEPQQEQNRPEEPVSMEDLLVSTEPPPEVAPLKAVLEVQYCSLNFVAQAVEPAEPRFISAFLAALDQR